MKTENLAILMTDIAGYTEATAHLSRKENERLLENHNRILLPIIRRFKGTLVKSIGDALLMVFRSPTDAMLCAMAMQDALFEYNRDLPEEQQIHIRVAASLGEVRVTRNDIFGEPVNTTSRIEGITPADEIYLSDAVYMAMNKAEVPCREVGLRQLKGISEQVRIWEIPRFSRPRLVPEDVMSAEDMSVSGIVFPYGGAHLMGRRDDTSVPGEGGGARKALMAGAMVVALVGTAAGFYYYGSTRTGPALSVHGDATAEAGVEPEMADEESMSVPEPEQEETSPSGTEVTVGTVPERATPLTASASRQPEKKEPVRAMPVLVKETPKPPPSPSPAPLAPKPEAYKVLVKEPLADVEIIPLETTETPATTSLSEVKKAYRAGELTREEYGERVQELKLKLREELQVARQEYSEGALDRRAYKEKVNEIKQKFR